MWATFSKLLGLGGRVGNTGNTNSMEEGVLLRSNHLATTSSSLLLPKQDIHRYGGRNFFTLRPRWLPRLGAFSVCSLESLSWLSGMVPFSWRNTFSSESFNFKSLVWEIEYEINLVYLALMTNQITRRSLYSQYVGRILQNYSYQPYILWAPLPD